MGILPVVTPAKAGGQAIPDNHADRLDSRLRGNNGKARPCVAIGQFDTTRYETALVACPITVGGGTRAKLLEAASYARPMVSTRIRAEGLEFVDGQEILLRDDDAAFADACARLLHDDALCAALGTAAHAKMAAIYDAEKIQDRIADLMLAKMTT